MIYAVISEDSRDQEYEAHTHGLYRSKDQAVDKALEYGDTFLNGYETIEERRGDMVFVLEGESVTVYVLEFDSAICYTERT